MSGQLQQATRIAELRERRAERLRREAKAAEAEKTAEAQQAHDIYRLEKERQANAEFMLLSNPADPQALLWRQVTEQNCDDAKAQRADAYERLSESRAHLAETRRAHERTVERTNIFGEKLQAERAAQAHRREILADEASEEARR